MLLHPLAFFGVLFLCTFIALNEFFLLSGFDDKRKTNAAYYSLGMITYVLIGLIGLGYIEIGFAFLLLLIFPTVVISELFRKHNPSWKRIGSYMSGIFYIAVPFGLLNALFLLPGHAQYTVSILFGMFVIIWASDVFAYLSGSMFGKTKLFERISPKKTWEGSIGGLIFALVAAYILSLFFKELTLAEWLVMAVIIVVTGTLGDLTESMLKREAGVKDSGNILPGHGGILDRFDATLFATPFTLVYINLI
jgi:phosphatidate cytidylyltransferase